MEAKQDKGNAKLMVAVAAVAAFLSTFNETYMNVAFASIMTDFSIGANTVQWVATAYMLGAAVMVPVSAFAFKSIRTRPLFCATAALLVLGSIIGALATSFSVLLAGRVVQALGTGMMVPIGMNITLTCAPREKLGVYMGIMGAMTTLGPSASIIVAGLLLSAFAWNALFWVFAGLSAACLVFGALVLRNMVELTHPRLDALSVAFVGLALVGLLYGVSSAFGGSHVVAACSAVLGVVFLVLFVRRQAKLTEPLVDLGPLGVPRFSMGVVANMLALLAIFAMNILVPTFLQSVLGIKALPASLALFPAILLSCAISPVAGRIYDRYGTRVLLPLGFALVAVFSLAVSLVITTGQVILVALLYIPIICGSALIIGPVQSFALSSLSREQNAYGVTILSTSFQIAGCVGSSVFVGVYGASMGMGLTAGATMLEAASTGFLCAGALVAVCGLLGVVLSVILNKRASSDKTSAKGETDADGELSAIMKRDVYALSPSDTVRAALILFAEKGVSGVPVVEDGIPVGFVSDGDVMRHLAGQTTSFKNAWSFIAEEGNEDFRTAVEAALDLSVGDVCAKRVIGVRSKDSLGEVCRVLVEHHLKKAPVLEDGKMIGVINRSNITKHAVEHYLDSSTS